ncbi:tail fiber assembly protein [Escherichia coli]|nr:tail fiber assembly protein [Escherichia coli]
MCGAPLLDAVELGIATDEETSLLAAWKKYRVLLNRVDKSTARILSGQKNQDHPNENIPIGIPSLYQELKKQRGYHLVTP